MRTARTEQNRSEIDAFLHLYFELGFYVSPAIITTYKEGDKLKVVKGVRHTNWNDYGQWPSPKEVNAWHNYWFNETAKQHKYIDGLSGIAAHTGEVSDKIVIIDIDVKNTTEGYEELKDVINLEEDENVVRTPSGGYHVYYKYETPLIGFPAQMECGVDILLSGHASSNPALLPPTRINIDGQYKTYSWNKKVPPVELPYIPDKVENVLRLLLAKQDGKNKKRNRGRRSEKDHELLWDKDGNLLDGRTPPAEGMRFERVSTWVLKYSYLFETREDFEERYKIVAGSLSPAWSVREYKQRFDSHVKVWEERRARWLLKIKAQALERDTLIDDYAELICGKTHVISRHTVKAAFSRMNHRLLFPNAARWWFNLIYEIIRETSITCWTGMTVDDEKGKQIVLFYDEQRGVWLPPDSHIGHIVDIILTRTPEGAELIQRIVDRIAIMIMDEDYKTAINDAKNIVNYIYDNNSSRNIRANIVAAHRSDNKSFNVHSFDTNPLQLCCGNGTIHINEAKCYEHKQLLTKMLTASEYDQVLLENCFELKDHSPYNINSKFTHVELDPKISTAPAIELLKTWFPQERLSDPDFLRNIILAIGSGFVGRYADKAIILYGEQARNGKTMLLEYISWLLGYELGQDANLATAYANTITAESLFDEKDSASALAEKANSAACRTVIVLEPKPNQINSQSLKRFADVGIHKVRNMFAEHQSYVNRWSVFISVNSFPNTAGWDNGGIRRLFRFPFEVRFEQCDSDKWTINNDTVKRIDPNLMMKLRSPEMSASFFRLFLTGACAFVANDSKLPNDFYGDEIDRNTREETAMSFTESLNPSSKPILHFGDAAFLYWYLIYSANARANYVKSPSVKRKIYNELVSVLSIPTSTIEESNKLRRSSRNSKEKLDVGISFTLNEKGANALKRGATEFGYKVTTPYYAIMDTGKDEESEDAFDFDD